MSLSEIYSSGLILLWRFVVLISVFHENATIVFELQHAPFVSHRPNTLFAEVQSSGTYTLLQTTL